MLVFAHEKFFVSNNEDSEVPCVFNFMIFKKWNIQSNFQVIVLWVSGTDRGKAAIEVSNVSSQRLLTTFYPLGLFRPTTIHGTL